MPLASHLLTALAPAPEPSFSPQNRAQALRSPPTHALPDNARRPSGAKDKCQARAAARAAPTGTPAGLQDGGGSGARTRPLRPVARAGAHTEGASGQKSERARLRGRQADGRSETPPENESAGAWGRGRSLEPRPPTFPPHPPPAQNQASARPTPVRVCLFPTFKFEVCGRVEDQDLLVLRHGPGGGRHRRDRAERGRARGDGLLAGGGERRRRRLGRALQWDQLTAPTPQRLPFCRRVGRPPAGSAAPGLTTDSTSHQPLRPRALQSSAPHVTASACLRARPGCQESLALVPPSSPFLRGAGWCACVSRLRRLSEYKPSCQRTGVARGRIVLRRMDAVRSAGAGGPNHRSRLAPITKLENPLCQCITVSQVGTSKGVVRLIHHNSQHVPCGGRSPLQH